MRNRRKSRGQEILDQCPKKVLNKKEHKEAISRMNVRMEEIRQEFLMKNAQSEQYLRDFWVS